MDFQLTREQQLLKKMAAQFAAQYCEPEAAELDETHEFLHDTWKKMAEVGLLRVNHDEKYGGTGHDSIAEMIVIEELAKASLTHGSTYALLANGFPTFIESFGTVDQKIERLRRQMLQGSGSKDMIAREMGISRATLYRWIKKYQIKDSWN